MVRSKLRQGAEGPRRPGSARPTPPRAPAPLLHAQVSDEKKKVSSTGGMENAVRTSKVFAFFVLFCLKREGVRDFKYQP